jgi:hypothetical protein
MATARPFAINLGEPINGTTQVGNIAIGTNPLNYANLGGATWYMGPDEDLGYIIAAQNGADPTFWRSTLTTEASFIQIVNLLPARQGLTAFTNSFAAQSWLTANGYATPNFNFTTTTTSTSTTSTTSTTTAGYSAGLYKRTYSGYFADSVSFFATATQTTFGANPGASVQTTAISEPGTDDGSTFSCQWLGYFKPASTETYTFYTSSDDASSMWIGANAVTGFTTGNATVQNGGLHGNVEASGTAALTSGTYYPVRIQFGENGGGDVLTFNYSTPNIAKTTNVTGLVFYNAATTGH